MLPLRKPKASPQPSPDHAWRLLAIVNDWIRHSDSKAAVTLAFVGASATLLFNLVKDSHARSCLFDVAVFAACVLILVTAGLCGWTLTPRINDADADPEAINRLFFGSITRHYKGNRPLYREVLSTLSANDDELIKDIADQIHANARIATIKAKYATLAIRCALATGLCIGVIALIS